MSSSGTVLQPSLQDHLSIYFLDYDACCDEFAYCLLTKEWTNHKQIIQLKALFEKGYLFTKILKEAEEASVQLMNGSNRQDLPTDTLNRLSQCKDSGVDPGSCFIFLITLEKLLNQKLAKELQGRVSVNKHTITDLYNELIEGDTFNQALNTADIEQMHHHKPALLQTKYQSEALDKNLALNRYFDDSKISLVYAAIHQLVLRNPGKKISFNVYDDRQDIYSGLAHAFSSSAEWIPHNVCLTIHHYPTKSTEPELTPQLSTSIPGSGKEPDYNYRQNTRLLYKCLALNELTSHSRKSLDLNTLTEAMRQFKESRKNLSINPDAKDTMTIETVRLFQRACRLEANPTEKAEQKPSQPGLNLDSL